MDEIKEQLKRAILKLFDVEIEPELAVPPAETGADFATNVAMRLAKIAHKAPMQIAEELKAEIENDSAVTEGLGETKIEIAAPGFINFISPDEYFSKKIAEIAENEASFDKFISCDEYSDKMVVAEFSDPNPFKVLHIGHFYTSVVGDAISNLLEHAKARVVRVNFGGDVGLHVGKTIYALLNSEFRAQGLASTENATAEAEASKSVITEAGTAPLLDHLTIEDIAKCYVEGTRAYEENEEAKQKITHLNKIIYAVAELGEERSRERLEIEMLAEDFGISTMEMAQIIDLYWRGRALSYQYFKDFYARIGVKFEKFYPESTVAGKGLEEVRDHIGTTYEESDGAIVYRGEKVGLHTRVFINREGIPTYETKDVGLLFTKWADWHFDESVVITGNEQSDYMKVVLASVHEYAPELVERTRHLTHGLVKLRGNVKMSSRKGNFLKAVDVLDAVKKSLTESAGSVEGVENIEGEESAGADEQRIQMITLAAIKYAFLKYKLGGDIIFDPKESVAMNGNSGVYLLYSAVRAKKILQKTAGVSGADGGDLAESEARAEKSLSKKVIQYREVLHEAVAEKAPYKICNYLYELAQEFSRFYEKVRVAGSVREAELRKLVGIYLMVMEHGLGLLGIEVPEEM